MSRYNLWCNNNGILLARSTLRTKKTMGDRAFMIAAPILWNSLPLSVRQAATVDNFKSMERRSYSLRHIIIINIINMQSITTNFVNWLYCF